MTSQLKPGTVFNALEASIENDALDADNVVSGTPLTGFLELDNLSGVELGIWEHTVGVSTDTETNEVFVVLSGKATIEFLDGNHDPVSVSAGSIVKLSEGMRTRWNVEKPLRKVYLIAAE